MADGDTTRVDQEQDDGDRQGRSRCVPHHSGIDSFAKVKLKIPPYNGNYDPAAYLHWELEVEPQFSCHDIPATSQVKTIISEFTNFALMWWGDYNKRQPSRISTTWAQLKAAPRPRFVRSYFA
jgi:hypothetical protein